jgi:hypothetical protein
VAKQGDGGLNRKGGGLVRRRVAKLVTRLLATAVLWVRQPDISLKFKIGRHEQRSGQHTLYRQEKIKCIFIDLSIVEYV